MRRLPPLNALRAFEAAARRGSFQLAAEELHVTPSAVSHQVRALEEHFGLRLFHRQGRRVALARQAADFLRSSTQALDQIAAASQRLMRRPGGNLLNIAVAPTFATGWLLPNLVEFQMAHPELELRMSTSTEPVSFVGTDLDLAISYSAGGFAPELQALWLTGEHCVPVCSPEYVRENGPISAPADVARCTLLHALTRTGQWRNWMRVAGVEGVDPLLGPKFQSTPLALEAAQAGLGLAIANLEFVEEHIRRGQLVAPFEVEVPSTSGYYLVYPQERADEPGITAFRAWLLARLAEAPAAAPG